MLEPEYLNDLPEPLVRLYEELEDWIIKDISRRIKKIGEVTSTAEQQRELLQALGNGTEELNKRIAKTLNISKDEVERLFDEAMAKSVSNYSMVLNGVGIKPSNDYRNQILRSAINAAQGEVENLTRTAGFITNTGAHTDITTAYRYALSFAAMQVNTGAIDYNTAIKNALKPFTSRGITAIDYKSGRKISIEAIVRQCVMQGARDMSASYMKEVARDIGADGFEISVHLNCAPDHQDVQGRQYSNEEYRELNQTLTRPIGTLNCRHMAFPIILGLSQRAHTDEELKELKAENQKGVTYEGRHYTLYEASQQQRKLERAIRKCKRQLIVADEFKNAKGNLANVAEQAEKDFIAQSIRLRRLREYYNDFSDKCKLTKRPELLGVGQKKDNVNSNRFFGDSGGLSRSEKRQLNRLKNLFSEDLSVQEKQMTVDEELAGKKYAQIRNLKDDIENISKNTVFTKKAVSEIKDYLFFNEKQFTPNLDVANAWLRLMIDKGTDTDILLLKHEYVELSYRKRYNVSYNESHNYANEKYSWSEALEEEQKNVLESFKNKRDR